MPQPVQPPETPAIIQSLTTEDAVAPLSSSHLSSVPTRLPQQTPKGLATPTPPETLPPEFSSDITSSQATLLGQSISARYAARENHGTEVSKSRDGKTSSAGHDLPSNRTGDSRDRTPQSLISSPVESSQLSGNNAEAPSQRLQGNEVKGHEDFLDAQDKIPAHRSINTANPPQQKLVTTCEPAGEQRRNVETCHGTSGSKLAEEMGTAADLQPCCTSQSEKVQADPISTTLNPSLTIGQQPRTNDQRKAEESDKAEGGRQRAERIDSDAFSTNLTSETTNASSVRSSAVTLELSNVERIMTQERGGEIREFEFTSPPSDPLVLPNPAIVPAPDLHQRQPRSQTSQPTPDASASEDTEPAAPGPITGVLEVTADQQEYDQQRQVITAQGDVLLRFRGALLEADRVQVNLPNRILVAEDNVVLTRGNQVLRGQRFEYSFVQDSGVIFDASGELYVPTSGTDLTILPSPADPNAPQEQRPISDRVLSNQPLQDITNPGFYSFFIGGSFGTTTTGNFSNVVSGAPQAVGTINRFRYEADRIDFEGSEAIAQNVRITNDPFSPPELELRAETARFRRISPLVDEIVATRPRLVFDQGLSVPTFRNRVVIDRREREPGLLQFGFDDDDRGGLFIERSFNIVNTPGVLFKVTPQYFLQRAVLGERNPNTPDKDDDGLLDPSSFGLKAQLDATFTPQTTLRASATFTSLDPDDFEEELRASVRLQQVIGTDLPHNLNLEYSFRDRLFNGSLGFQTVQQSLGAVITSPVIRLGDTGINLTYQAGIQAINARTDRQDLLPPPPRDNNRIDLTRYQASATLSRSFTLWRGEALPLTPTEGLRYTPRPVVPFLAVRGVVTGVASAYSSGDTQESLSGTVGLVGQLGHFSRPYLDYTRFNLSYTQVARGNLSPFRFDRVADRVVLSAGISQQIYGPFLAGFQTSFNLDTGEEISTDLFLEYSRRTYSLLLRYNPVQELGSISLRINDFNWAGNPGLFDGSAIRPVVQGVTR
ncbi:OstA-like protein [Coleofasciculus chthonoplastes PCC 7420]|uniref:OstA-like protein n=1 Tax=Coleofasciculus chthonoplastes PCC 7420 TaxID=118168 RepID=B4VK85_9CYAN|nr:DUF3769 domain-containing protein [Coleofasciculus chthonoplastes]EDX77626.1 OstA-like protein [Coleofasciculus chthonoplastes PCC 7420]